MSSAGKLVQASFKYLGTPYSKMDCQALVEACLKDIGISKNLPGSNAWYRTMTWVGSPEECKRYFGKIPIGAFLFILKHDDREPEKYKSDGIGNASHIGIYTGMTGKEMLKDCPAYMELEHTSQRNAFEKKVQFGNGAIHSSSSRDMVCTSNFDGKSIDGGWNRVGLWDRLSYDIDFDGSEETVMQKATVHAPAGATVNMRTRPKMDAPLVERVPVGSQVEIESESSNWAYIHYGSKVGYMMTDFLLVGDVQLGEQEKEPDTVTVSREWLKELYQKVGDLLGVKG